MSAPERVLLVHNYYQQPGGEDSVFAAESELLRSRGHEVATFTVHNDRIDGMRRLPLAARTIWNRPLYRELQRIVLRLRPGIVHFHNTFPLISPSAYAAVHELGIPVVQTLHNFRIMCLNGLLFRAGRPCEDCIGRPPLAGVAHGCYRGDRSASGVVAAMLVVNRLRRTFTRLVDRYIALTEAGREKFVAAGLPRDKLVIKPNFLVNDPGSGSHDGGNALYVGRLSSEKGIDTLLTAWKSLGDGAPRLTLVGDGPLRHAVRAASESTPTITLLGHEPHDRVMQLMQAAQFLVFPSVCYEGFGMAIAEALATGLPIVASSLGSSASLVRDHDNGLHFRPGDAADLRAAIQWAVAHPHELRQFGRAARLDYETKYTADVNYDQLMDIYAQAESLAARRR
ncbi:MAG: glycosyltransferase family 4 protein [Chloroflexi bacterium]|nr:glycosyltransferase family 4 protein [Chloroflexota bacterium]